MATFDVHKAINYLQTHKKGGSTGNCAAYTKRALQAGGLPYCSGDGWSVVDTYIQYGFKYINVKINGQKIVGMVAGDICSIACNKRSPKYPNYNKGGEVYPGHACMFDGTQWISDYAQGQKAIPYSQSNVKWVKVARWKDIPGDFKISSDGISYSGENSTNTTDTSFGNFNTGPAQIIIQDYVYPTHSEYVTYAGIGGNIFEKSKDNAITFTQAAYSVDNTIDKQKNENHTRIYSTNDAVIVLDELHLPMDDENITYANKGITEKDVIAHNNKLKQQEEDTKKKQEDEKKKQEESTKENQEGETPNKSTNNTDTSKTNNKNKSTN